MLTIMQQVLYGRIQTLATYAPEDQRERYQWAANSFRIPYWDWSLGDGGGGVPDFFVTETTMVDTPEGRRIEIWNPLYKYTFKSIPDGFDDKVRSICTEASLWLMLNYSSCGSIIQSAGQHQNTLGKTHARASSLGATPV
jgi:hypothetical protein